MTTAHHRLTFSKERGGCLTSLVLDGVERLQGLGFDLVAYADDGGLWRLGHEYRGGRFTPIDRVSQRPARIHVHETGDTLSVVLESTLGGKAFTRTVTCRRDDPLLEVEVTGFAARRHTVTCRFEMTHEPRSLAMDTLGGLIERPRERAHAPTFWPVPSRVTLHGKSGELHVGFEAPTAVSFSPAHALEWIVARNPMKERAFGLLPVLAHPVGGTVDERQTHRAAVFATKERGLTMDLAERLELLWLPDAHRALKRYADALVHCDDPSVSFVAVKRAERGAGVMLRLSCDDGAPRTVRVWLSPSIGRIWGAFRSDAREEELEPLALEGAAVLVPLASRMSTVRIVVR